MSFKLRSMEVSIRDAQMFTVAFASGKFLYYDIARARRSIVFISYLPYHSWKLGGREADRNAATMPNIVARAI